MARRRRSTKGIWFGMKGKRRKQAKKYTTIIRDLDVILSEDKKLPVTSPPNTAKEMLEKMTDEEAERILEETSYLSDDDCDDKTGIMTGKNSEVTCDLTQEQETKIVDVITVEDTDSEDEERGSEVHGECRVSAGTSMLEEHLCTQCSLVFQTTASLEEHKESVHCEGPRLNPVSGAQPLQGVLPRDQSSVRQKPSGSQSRASASTAKQRQRHKQQLSFRVTKKQLSEARTSLGPSNPTSSSATTSSSGMTSSKTLQAAPHPPLKPFRCFFCSADFRRKEELQSHIQIHTLEFYCQKCVKYFTDKSTLERHMAVHDTEEIEECGLCSSYFASRQELFQHVVEEHASQPKRKSVWVIQLE